MINVLTTSVQIIFILSMFVFCYLGVGLLLIKKLNLKFTNGEKLLIGTISSISLITTLIALVGQFISSNALYLLIPFYIIGLTQYKDIFKLFRGLSTVVRKNILGTIFILISVAVLTSTMIFTKVGIDGAISFQEIHDSMWHIALVQNLQESIPPLHPSTETVSLNNYHYFYDLFLSGFAKFSNISDFTLYFQVSVIFLSLSILGSAFVLGQRIKNSFAGYLLIGATTFIGSISYLIPVFFHPEQSWGESSFWVSQTLVMIVNPQVIYTLAVTYLTVLLLFKLDLIKKITSKSKKEYIGLNILIIILTTTSIGFKSYAWVILSVIYAVVLLREISKHRSILPFGIGLLYSLVSLPIVWLITRFQGGSFFYEPLWFTNSMIESPDRVNYLEWKFLQDHYVFKKNWLRLIELEAKKLVVFYLGNLGIRSFFLALPILVIFKKTRKNINWTVVGYIFVGFLFSSIFPLLFLQSGTVWNSIQFWYYSLIFANILLVIFLSEVFEKKPKIVISIILVILFLIAFPTGIKTIQDKTREPEIIRSDITAQLSRIDPESSILVCPQGNYVYHSALIKVLTPASIYLANPSQLTLVGTESDIAEKYEKLITDNRVEELKQIIRTENVSTIVCTDRHLTTRFEEMLNKANLEFETEIIEKWKFINL